MDLSHIDALDLAEAEAEAEQEDLARPPVSRDFTVQQQNLELEVDFATQSLKGITEIIIVPLSKDLRKVSLHCRVSKITYLTIDGRPATGFDYSNPYDKTKPHKTWDAHQYHLFRERFKNQYAEEPREELSAKFPRSVVVQEITSTGGPQDGFFSRAPRGNGSISVPLETPPTSTAELDATYAPITLKIGFETPQIRDGLHFVGMNGNDQRYPHAYTTNSSVPGPACALFPCLDDPSIRCHWSVTIKYPRTLGDALKIPLPAGDKADDGTEGDSDLYLQNEYGLTEKERALEMVVACSGTVSDESPAPTDSSQKISTFMCDLSVSANQIGFAIGPFERVDLSSEFRESEDDEKVGDEALAISALCLPGRADEVRNTAFPMPRCADYFSSTFVTHAFPAYQMCFVDDLPSDTIITAALSFCSSRLLFSGDTIDPMYDSTRKLVHTLAAQYSGIGIAPRETFDIWCVEGMAQFMTGLFMKQICGSNEYRFQQKLAADRIFDLDHDRPSMYTLGGILHLHPSLGEFMALKASVVLFILDRRLAKSSGTSGMAKIIMRTLANAKSSFDNEGTLLSTAQFQRTCEKIGHCKLDGFFQQWVFGAGCPHFIVSQRFNKKKLVVEMQITQVQNDPERQMKRSKELDPDNFIRDVVEETHDVYAAGVQNAFTGPMTIRIHEADGTPYEHIVDIKDQNTKIEIPYNTKYKRLKRSRRQKERAAANAGVDLAAEPQDDTLLYCLGDVLESEDEVSEWRLQDWPKSEEDKMSQESYEWIRMDADFEWICKLTIGMPAYMYVSQLQQDRDVAAQYDSLQWISSQQPHPLISTFLTRTIMDKRYFHGIRTLAASILPKCAREELQGIGQYHLEKVFGDSYCGGDIFTTLPNDFSDRSAYLVQCAILRAMANIRDNAGRTPVKIKRFFLDKLKFNDNSTNEFSDNHYVATLMSCMAETLIQSNETAEEMLSMDEREEAEHLQKEAIGEIERYRRIDEWISSHHNIYSVTALECLLQLAKAKLLQPKMADFLRYTHHNNADAVRLQAFVCLTELGGLRNSPVSKYMFRCIGTDPSPYMRNEIYAVLGRGLGRIAIGKDKDRSEQRSGLDDLLVEEDATEARQTWIKRTQTVAGASAALLQELESVAGIPDGIWQALTSPIATLGDLRKLFGASDLLIRPTNRMLVNLRYPHFWRVQNLGDGKLRFFETDRIRTKPRKPRKQEPQPVPEQPTEDEKRRQGLANLGVEGPPPPPSRKPSMKISLGSLQRSASGMAVSTVEPSPRPTPSIAPEAVDKKPPMIKLKKPGPDPSSPLATSRPKPKPFPAATPSDRPSKMVLLKSARLKDPLFQKRLSEIVPQPPNDPEDLGEPLPRALSIKIGGGGPTAQFRTPQTPVIKQEQSLTGPNGGGVDSPDIAGRPTVNRAGTKRKSETPAPQQVEPSMETNGVVPGDPPAKKRKNTPTSRRSQSVTSAQSSPLGPPTGLAAPTTAPPNPKKRKSDAFVGTDGLAASDNGETPAKRHKGQTPSHNSPPPSLVVKLKVPSTALHGRSHKPVEASNNVSITRVDGSESPDVPLASRLQTTNGGGLQFGPISTTVSAPAPPPMYGPINPPQTPSPPSTQDDPKLALEQSE